LSINGLSINHLPAPAIKFTVTFWQIIDQKQSMNKFTDSGVLLDGFTTTVFPAARAGAIIMMFSANDN